AGKLAAEVGMEADVVEGQEVPRLDRPPLVGAQRIAIEDGGFVGGEFRAQLDRPFQVLDQVVNRKGRVKFLESHERLSTPRGASAGWPPCPTARRRRRT